MTEEVSDTPLVGVESAQEPTKMTEIRGHETESALTSSGGSASYGDIDGDSTMSRPPEDLLEEAISLIRQAFAVEGKRAIDSFVAGLQSSHSGQRSEAPVTRHPQAEKSNRAPAGSARVLCRRVLAEAKNNGLTVMKIQAKAEGEYEQMLSISAVRNELTTGERLVPSLYKQVGGVWYLAEYAPPPMRVVG